MKAWKMPEEVIVAAQEHHNEDYRGEYAVYPQLVLLTDRLLKAHDIGDAPNSHLPLAALDSLELGEYQAVTIADRILNDCENLDVMAQQFAS